MSLRVWRAQRSAAALSVVLASACAIPGADVFVAWVELQANDNGRDLHVYDHGDLWRVTLDSSSESLSAPTLMQLAVDDRGRGVAVFGAFEGRYERVSDGRVWAFDVSQRGPVVFADGFAFTRNGDAIFRTILGTLEGPAFASGSIALYPFVSGVEGPIVVEPPPATIGGTMIAVTASNAPVLFWLEQNTGSTNGTVRVVTYPSDLSTGPRVSTATEVVTGVMATRFVSGGGERRIPSNACLGATCISPDGGSAIAIPAISLVSEAPREACTLAWWHWDGDAKAVQTNVVLGSPCLAQDHPHVLAQLADDLAVLEDNERIYLVDLAVKPDADEDTDGDTDADDEDTDAAEVEVEVRLKVGLKPWYAYARALQAARGRALVLVSNELEVMRVDEGQGVRVVSAERTECPTRPFTGQTHLAGVLTSPDGRWVLAWCNGDDATFNAEVGLAYRISPLGFEVYSGVAMIGLGIDDDGNAMLSSIDDDGRPRDLFVLAGDGVLTRVDDLEPEPAALAMPSGYSPFFALIDPSL